MISTSPRLSDVYIATDSFWGRRRAVNRAVSIPTQFSLLKSTHRLAALDPAYRGKRERFWDSDSAKWLEAAWSELASGGHDVALSDNANEVQNALAKAQEPDGYLQSDVSYTPMRRWGDLIDGHELYSMGHVIEACCAQHENRMGDAGLRIARAILERLWIDFGPDAGQAGFCGHPEIEMALMRLWYATKDHRARDLCQQLVDRRGTNDCFDREMRGRGKLPHDHWLWRFTKDWTYYGAGRPLRETTDAAGHVVRALYLYCGATDLLHAGDKTLAKPMDTLWSSGVRRRMHVTGGMGAHPEGERFGEDYDLPNERSYCETCAAIALARWARRLLDVRLDAEFGDVMELTLHNAVLSGVSLAGDTYFYSNPTATHPHDTRDSEHLRRNRAPWFGCACCPPNLARTLSQLASFAYAVHGEQTAIHLYVPGEMLLGALNMRVETRMPNDGSVRLTVLGECPVTVELAMRIPSWSVAPKLRIAGRPMAVAPGSYARVRRSWTPGETVDLDLPMPVQRLYPHPEVRQCAGQVALRRGPLVWCLEQIDNGPNLAGFVLPDTAVVTCIRNAGPGGTDLLRARGMRAAPAIDSPLYTTTPPTRVEADLTFVPYAVWANRGDGEMRVWVRRN